MRVYSSVCVRQVPLEPLQFNQINNSYDFQFSGLNSMVEASEFEILTQFETSILDGPFFINMASIYMIRGIAFTYTNVSINLSALLHWDIAGWGVGLGIC